MIYQLLIELNVQNGFSAKKMTRNLSTYTVGVLLCTHIYFVLQTSLNDVMFAVDAFLILFHFPFQSDVF